MAAAAAAAAALGGRRTESWRTHPTAALAQRPTPLQRMSRVEDAILRRGVRLLVKRDDLTGAAVSGNKVRKLEFLLADALRSGADAIVTCGGVQSNHAR